MEKTKKTTKKKITPAENKPSEEELNRIKGMRIFGYEDSMQVARGIMGSIHENLLHGDLIFAYRSTATSNKYPTLPAQRLETNHRAGQKGNKIIMQITEAFKGKTLVITGGTGSFASA
jgi:hypothetical protein